MGTIRRTLLAGLVAVTAAGCGSDQTGPSPSTLTATWNATSAQFVSVANPSQMAELVGMGGSVALTLNANNTFTMTTTTPGKPVEQLAGTWSSSTDVLTLTYGSGNSQFDMTLNGDTLLLTGANGSFDVNGDSADEEVKVNLTLLRG